jgi:flagellar hook-length control protein FliK
MQVAQVNSSVASALGQAPADETPSRADDFARMLQTAVYGRGSEAVAKTTERAMSAAAPRTETRTVERRERAEPAPRTDNAPEPSRETTAPRDTRDTAAAQKPADTKATDKPAAQTPARNGASEQPAKTETAAPQEKPATEPTAEPTAQQAETQDAGDVAEETLEEAADKPVVAEAPDASLILALLQTQVVSADAVTAAPVTEGTAVSIAPALPAAGVVSPEEAAAAALAAAAQAQAKTAAPMQADAAAEAALAEAGKAAVPTLPLANYPQIKTATDTSAAALMSQQQTLSAEEFAALQQALTAQNQGQVQVLDQTGKPVVTAEAKQKAEPKAEKSLTLDIQTVSATPKTLVDQATLFVMQDDDAADADAALLMQQQQAQTAPQPATQDLKFNAALLQAAADDIALQSGSTTASSNGQSQQTAAIGATSATQATSSVHQTAATQTAARHLNAYVPVGEQVGVQIKKGVADGLDKISIKLDPGNLGKVEIKLEIGHDGRLQAVIAADKPETLQLLQQDVKNLEQSLRDSGLKTDQQSLSFTLRDQSQAGEGRDGNGNGNGRQRHRSGDDYAETGAQTDPAQLAAANAQRAAAARGGLDIRI